ncbi:MAG: branched-chain amino acid ABC transporter permease [Actinomycetota bacterium]
MSSSAMITFKDGSPEHRRFQIVTWIVFGIIVILLPYALRELFGPFMVSRLNRALYIAVAILGVNLVVGYAGLIALGHSAFMGIGAFVTATILMDEIPRVIGDVNPSVAYLVTIPFAMLAAFVVGVLFGIPALRIKGLYLALLTIAFAAVFPTLTKLDALGIADRTGGVNGRNLAEIPSPGWAQSLLFIDDTPNQQAIYKYFIFMILTVLATLGTRNLLKSRPGRAIVAIRDNETGAAVSGVNLPLYKTLTFGFSAALGALAGSMWAMNTNFVGEQDFGFAPLAVPLLVGLVIGGVAKIEGAFLGSFVVVFVNEFFKGLGWEILSQAAFGVILIFFTFVAPGGLASMVSWVRRQLVAVIPQPPAEALAASAADAAEKAVPEPAV